MADSARKPCIYVLAGTNGAGKSSVIGAMLLDEGTEYFNPDLATNSILAANPGISLAEANSLAWRKGKAYLERAIRQNADFAFETTLGGNTITALLMDALGSGIEVRMWYVGLSSVELHLKRVRSRVQHGGHNIPAGKIYERYSKSRMNLIDLLPLLTELRVYDNSAQSDPLSGVRPEPTLLLHCANGRLVQAVEIREVPSWAKPIFAAAMRSK